MISEADLGGQGCLRRKPCVHQGFLGAVAVHGADHLIVFWRGDHHEWSKLIGSIGFDEQRCFVTGERFFAQFEATHLDFEGSVNVGMSDFLEAAPSAFVAEHDAAQLGAVKSPILVQDLRTKLLDDPRKAKVPRLDDTAGELIRVEDWQFAGAPSRCDGAFAGAEPACQPEHMTLHARNLSWLRLGWQRKSPSRCHSACWDPPGAGISPRDMTGTVHGSSAPSGFRRPLGWSVAVLGVLLNCLLACRNVTFSAPPSRTQSARDAQRGMARGGETPGIASSRADAPRPRRIESSASASKPMHPGALGPLHPPMRQLWQAGAGLASLPGIAPDGALYIASRQGTFDVLEADGTHRFTITLDGTPTGTMHVDPKGWAYVGLATGKLLAITPDGRKYFTYVSANGIRSDLDFAPGIGLLFRGRGGMLEGVNRGGFPTIRTRYEPSLVAGPIGLDGWYVVATSRDEVVWGDRWGRKIPRAVGSPIRQLLSAPHASVWALSESSLVAFSPKREVQFRRAGVVAMTVASARLAATGIAGAVIDADRRVEWLDQFGKVAASASASASKVIVPGRRTLEIRLDDAGVLWLVEGGERLWLLRPDGTEGHAYDFPPDALLPPCMDTPRRRTIIGTATGAIYQVDWPSS